MNTQTVPQILDARPAFGSAVPSADSRCVHVTPADLSAESIQDAAMAARQKLCREAAEEAMAVIAPLNRAIRAGNAQALWNGADPERGMMSPVKASRSARHSKESVRRGFRFTVEGLNGIYKLCPLRRIA